MFKKRIIKEKKEEASSKPKRKLELSESESETEQDGKCGAESSSSNGIKKRKPISNTRKPNKEVDHGKEDTGTVALSNPSLKEATMHESEEGKSMGPLKAVPVNIKTTTITDFQPDVCKDFLQTGYCGYGDTCKFLHVRDELKQRQPIEREWETVQQKKDQHNEEEQVPYRCVLCKKDYTQPVRAQCNHIFCQKCFMNRYKNIKKPNCFICGKDTGGVCSPILKKELDKLITQ